MPAINLSPTAIAGNAILIPNNVHTGMIVPIALRGSFNIQEFKEHCFDNLDPKLRNRIAQGDILVAGRGFAGGETGEESVMALKSLGIAAIVAVSMNRLFMRNAINLGFPVVILPTAFEMINDGDHLIVDPYEAIVRNTTQSLAARGRPLPRTFVRILESGGIVNDVLDIHEKKRTKSTMTSDY